MFDEPKRSAAPRTLRATVEGRLLLAALSLAVCGHMACACRIDEGKDPDQAPERGFNPVESGNSPKPSQNQLEPLDPRYDQRCTARLEEEQLGPGGVAFFEVKLTGTPAETAVDVTIRDPGRLDYSRDWMQILEPGIYTVQISTAEGEGCWSGAEIASDNVSYTLVITYP